MGMGMGIDNNNDNDNNNEDTASLLLLSPEKLYRQTVEAWEQKQQLQQQSHSHSYSSSVSLSVSSSSSSWSVWKGFAKKLTTQFEQLFIIRSQNNKLDLDSDSIDSLYSVTDIVGAMEEGILTIERLIFQSQSTHMDASERDSALAVLYTEYGRLLLYCSSSNSHSRLSSSTLLSSTPLSSSSVDVDIVEDADDTTTSASTSTSLVASRRCYELANDPHTLLIGAPERIQEYNEKVAMMNGNDSDDSLEVISLFGQLCRDNAENAIRNAISLDATNDNDATFLLETYITTDGVSTAESVHKRKPKEFVAELFDSFAETFDSKLVDTLKYQVPQLIGSTVQEILSQLNDNDNDSSTTTTTTYNIQNVLDAGCGTGLAGRELRNVIDDNENETDTNQQRTRKKRMTLVGVDASKKMLQIAQKCTFHTGCGLPTTTTTTTTTDSPQPSLLLYDQLLQMDLEDITIQNTLLQVPQQSNGNENGNENVGFDLIVAADVFVYFDSLQKILHLFSQLQQHNSSSNASLLVFTCERTTNQEAPLGYRLLSTGRFAHTYDHVIQAATIAGYTSKQYKHITPRYEKGLPVQGHLFVFEIPHHQPGHDDNNDDSTTTAAPNSITSTDDNDNNANNGSTRTGEL